MEDASFPRNKSRAAALEDWQTRMSRGSLPRCVSGIRRMLDLATMPGLLIIGRPKSMVGVDLCRLLERVESGSGERRSYG